MPTGAGSSNFFSSLFSTLQGAMGSAGAVSGWQNIGSLASDIVFNMPIIGAMVGFCMIVWSFKVFLEAGGQQSRRSGGYALAFGLLFGGGMISILSTFVNSTQVTLFGVGSGTGMPSYTNSPPGGGVPAVIGWAVQNLTTLLGWVSIFRGLWSWSHAGDPNYGGGGKSPFWRGVTHVLAGGLAANMAGTVGMFASTIL